MRFTSHLRRLRVLGTWTRMEGECVIAFVEMLKHSVATLCVVVASLASCLGAPTSALACTAVYVGCEASDDGTVIIAKSNDYQAVWPNYVEVTERVDNKPGRTMQVDNDVTVFAGLPATTYRYTSMPFMDSSTAMNGLGHDATVCANEYGVTMVMPITAFSNDAALEADPLIEHGITEFTAVDLATTTYMRCIPCASSRRASRR